MLRCMHWYACMLQITLPNALSALSFVALFPSISIFTSSGQYFDENWEPEWDKHLNSAFLIWYNHVNIALAIIKAINHDGGAINICLNWWRMSYWCNAICELLLSCFWWQPFDYPETCNEKTPWKEVVHLRIHQIWKL